MVYCDNKGTLRNVFEKDYHGISLFLYSDFDSIKAVEQLLQIMQVVIKPKGSEGTLQPKSRPYRRSLTY
jgi:hypothetical protein